MEKKHRELYEKWWKIIQGEDTDFEEYSQKFDERYAEIRKDGGVIFRKDLNGNKIGLRTIEKKLCVDHLIGT